MVALPRSIDDSLSVASVITFVFNPLLWGYKPNGAKVHSGQLVLFVATNAHFALASQPTNEARAEINFLD